MEGIKRLQAETIAAWRACRIIEGVEDVGVVNVSDDEEEWHDAEDGGVAVEAA